MSGTPNAVQVPGMGAVDVGALGRVAVLMGGESAERGYRDHDGHLEWK